MNQPKSISIIGTGLLGQAIIDRLFESDYVVTGFDVDSERCAELQSKGVQVASSAAECAAASQVLILSLPDSQIVDEVVSAIATSLPESSTVIDTTTGPSADARSHATLLRQHGNEFLDATVAGSSVQVRNGEGVIMVGGKTETYESQVSLFNSLTDKLFHVGDIGAGCDMKLIVNLALGLNRAVLAEALALAESADVDKQLALEVMKSTAAYSAAMDSKGLKMVNSDFEPQARLRQHLKDVLLIQSMGNDHDQALPLSDTHQRLLSEAVASGLGDLDNSAIFQLIRKGRS